eukprot:596220-Amphidinium_carterae.1
MNISSENALLPIRPHQMVAWQQPLCLPLPLSQMSRTRRLGTQKEPWKKSRSPNKKIQEKHVQYQQ